MPSNIELHFKIYNFRFSFVLFLYIFLHIFRLNPFFMFPELFLCFFFYCVNFIFVFFSNSNEHSHKWRFTLDLCKILLTILFILIVLGLKCFHWSQTVCLIPTAQSFPVFIPKKSSTHHQKSECMANIGIIIFPTSNSINFAYQNVFGNANDILSH